MLLVELLELLLLLLLVLLLLVLLLLLLMVVLLLLLLHWHSQIIRRLARHRCPAPIPCNETPEGWILGWWHTCVSVPRDGPVGSRSPWVSSHHRGA